MTPTHVWIREHYEPANLRIAAWHLQGILAASQVLETLRSMPRLCAFKMEATTMGDTSVRLPLARHLHS